MLLSDGDGRVFALTVLEGLVISRHRSGRVRAWDARAGEGRRGLAGHTRDAASLCGLASGTSIDGQGVRARAAVRVTARWDAGGAHRWRCHGVASPAGWEGKRISGHAKGPFADAISRRGGWNLNGHGSTVRGLLVHGKQRPRRPARPRTYPPPVERGEGRDHPGEATSPHASGPKSQPAPRTACPISSPQTR